jgi:predicted amidophosphoribosyltransferase
LASRVEKIVVLCPRCRSRVALDEQCCHECGSDVRRIVSRYAHLQNNEVTVFCSKCGTQSSSGLKFCGRCGTDLTETIAKATQAQATAEVVTMVICPRCQNKVPATNKFCPKCGADFRVIPPNRRGGFWG